MTSPETSSSATTLLFSPLSPCSDYDELPIIPTDDRGMIIKDGGHDDNGAQAEPVVKKKATRRPKRQPIQYVSRHFSTDSAGRDTSDEARKTSIDPATPPQTPAKPRIYHGLNVDDLSSDSSLTDVPDDIGPDPFLSPSPSSIKPSSSNTNQNPTKKKRNPTKSPFFPHPHRHRPTFLSTLPFPPLSSPRFGLMQERLAHDPFRLLIATVFLNKTPGERAMPVFFQLMDRYPTPRDLAGAEVADVTSIIHHLGFQNQRARKCVGLAKVWIERAPEKGRRYRKLGYPEKGDGRDVKDGEVLEDKDERVAWEISHLPGVGAYGHDSWRMFCRDRLRGVAKGWNGEGAADEKGFEPEWKRVLPLDKELRAWMTWMWMKEGWVWNKETGKRTRASKELMEMANGGGIVVEEREKDTLTIQSVQVGDLEKDIRQGGVARPAGEILDENDIKREEGKVS